MDLPDDLPLPLRSGRAYWYWLGGRPSLDFVNTLRERWWRRVETLVTGADLSDWLREAELLPQGSKARATGAQLIEARQLREAIDAGLEAVVAEAPVPASNLRILNSHLPASRSGERLVPDDGGAPILVPAPSGDAITRALGLLAHDAATLLGTAERGRARICASDTCSCRFFDRSPGGARRWCSMGGCGNTAKARRHRARVRSQP